MLLAVVLMSICILISRAASIGKPALDYACIAVVACSGIPFTAAARIGWFVRVFLSILSIAANFAIALFWALLFSCALFRTCP
jgi:hypothetical protein